MAEDFDHFTEPTTAYWQRIEPADMPEERRRPPYRFGYPAPLPDGRFLILPIRRRANDPDAAVASLIPNHASFEVIDALSEHMAALARPLAPDVVVAMPTLGLALAPPVARLLGHENYVPLGYSRKFWYRDALSRPVHSITSPGGGKTVYLDPNLVPRLDGRRVLMTDDTISSGTTTLAVLDLLQAVGAEVVGISVAMKQSRAWREQLAARDPALPALVRGVFDSPLLRRVPDGWVPSA